MNKFALVALFCFMACPSGVSGPAEDDLAILFVGNSLTYTNDLPGILRDLLQESVEGGVFVESIAAPNFGLEDHWYDGPTRDRIAAERWDVVIMQQGPSATEGRPSLIEYSALLAELIRENGAVPGLLMVWPAESRTFDFPGVRESYAAATDSVDGFFFPAGAAWQEAWKVDPGLELYGSDGFHPSPLGSYLAAVVIWEQLAGTSAAELENRVVKRYGGVTVTPSVGRVLHRAASEANRKYQRAPAMEADKG